VRTEQDKPEDKPKKMTQQKKTLHQQWCREFVLPLIALSPLSTIFPIFDFIVID
jgi:hypothetical protein